MSNIYDISAWVLCWWTCMYRQFKREMGICILFRCVSSNDSIDDVSTWTDISANIHNWKDWFYGTVQLCNVLVLYLFSNLVAYEKEFWSLEVTRNSFVKTIYLFPNRSDPKSPQYLGRVTYNSHIFISKGVASDSNVQFTMTQICMSFTIMTVRYSRLMPPNLKFNKPTT